MMLGSRERKGQSISAWRCLGLLHPYDSFAFTGFKILKINGIFFKQEGKGAKSSGSQGLVAKPACAVQNPHNCEDSS
jgi:hypothetical protein